MISLGACSWIKMVDFWYTGRGEAIGVMLAANPELYIFGCNGGCEKDEFGRQ